MRAEVKAVRQRLEEGEVVEVRGGRGRGRERTQQVASYRRDAGLRCSETGSLCCLAARCHCCVSKVQFKSQVGINSEGT